VLYFFVKLILEPVPPFPTHLFLHPSLLPTLIHHCDDLGVSVLYVRESEHHSRRSWNV